MYLALKHRIISNYLENPETATENLREVKPTVFGADTEAWERLHARITAQSEGATGAQKALYRWAIGAGAIRRPVAVLWRIFWCCRRFARNWVSASCGCAYVGDRSIPRGNRSLGCARLAYRCGCINPFRKGETYV